MRKPLATAFRLLLAIAAVCAVSSSASADQCIRWQTAKAPCEGMLGPSSQFKHLLLCDTVKLPDCERKRVRQVAKLVADLKLAMRERDTSRREAGDLRMVVIRLGDELRDDVGWYEHPGFWAPVGAVLGGVLVWLVMR